MRLLLSPLSFLLLAVPAFAQTPATPAEPAKETPSEPAAPAVKPARPALAVGDSLPPVVLEELAQTQAKSYSDFYGRPVLIEFFAFWCGPCALSVKHLNELQATYGPRGLVVVGVTTENMKKTAPWIEKTGAEYAYGRDPTGEIYRLFQIQSIPSAVLVDAYGTVQWTGRPTSLRGETIEGVLAGALPRPVWEWPEAARPLAEMLARSDYADALQAAATVPALDGVAFTDVVRGRFTPLVARFEQLVTQADYGTALDLGTRLAKGLGSLPEGEKVVARVKELRDDPAIMRKINDQERIFQLETTMGTVRKPADAQELRTEVAAFLDTKPGEDIERRAKILLDTLDRNLAKAGKAKGEAKAGAGGAGGGGGAGKGGEQKPQ